MRQLSPLVLLLCISVAAYGQTITSVNLSWSPAVLTVLAGTPITITVTGNHHMREVSQATWDVDGTTSNGGFDYLTGTHTLTLPVPGTYWYVCVTHVDSGMKGRIIVEADTRVPGTAQDAFAVFPNPATNEITATAPVTQRASSDNYAFTIVAANGKVVATHRNIRTGDRVDVSGLSSGVYSIRFIDDRSAPLGNWRFVKL